MEERFERIEKDLAEAAQIIKHLAVQQSEFEERHKRIERHLEVLVDITDGLIRDRRFRELEKRVQELEEGRN